MQCIFTANIRVAATFFVAVSEGRGQLVRDHTKYIFSHVEISL